MNRTHVATSGLSRGLLASLPLALLFAGPVTAQMWQQVDSATIDLGLDTNGNHAFHSGMCDDVLPLSSGDCLVASQTGGVWIAYANGAASALSNDWKLPDVECLTLVRGSEKYVMAGGAGLYVTDYNNASPLFHWFDVTPPPLIKFGWIHRIAYFSHDTPSGTLEYVAIATNGGFYYCQLPPMPSGPYVWKRAFGLPVSNPPCAGLAAGAIGTGEICVSLATVGMGADLGPHSIFHGEFNLGGDLVFSPTKINFQHPVDEKSLTWTSLDSCAAQPNRMYGVLFDGTNVAHCTGILRSDDTGRTWKECSHTFDDGNPFNTWKEAAIWLGQPENGGLVKNIAVHPVDPDRVHVAGLQPLLSIDGGKSWQSTGGAWTSKGIWTPLSVAWHADWHVVRFDPTSMVHAFGATDGGLLDAFGSVPPMIFYSGYNAHLYTMQHGSYPPRGFMGYCDFSELIPGMEGMCSSGLQDDGTITALVPDGVPPPWTEPVRGDGGWNTFIETPVSSVPTLVSNIPTCPSTQLRYVAGAWKFDFVIMILSDDFGKVDPFGLADPILCKVNNLGFSDNKGNALFAVAVGNRWDPTAIDPQTGKPTGAFVSKHNQIFGLFGDPTTSFSAWEYLGDVGNGEEATALATWDGREIVVGTDHGGIRKLTTLTGQSSAVSSPNYAGTVVLRFALTGPTSGFATYCNSVGGTVLTLDSNGSWYDPSNFLLPWTMFYDLCFDPASGKNGLLFVCADNRVFRSNDGAQTWTDVSIGLPETPHCATLHTVQYPNGTRYLYMTTWGRSLWRRRLTLG